MSAELRVDKEFEALCPKLTEREFSQLEAAIEADGCRDAIVVWAGHDDLIVDGHNRYKICRSKGLGFKTKALAFPSRDHVKAWIIRNQDGRRNLDATQRAAMAALLASLKVGDNQHTKTAEKQGEEPLHMCRPSVAEVAKEMNVSPRSVESAKKVFEKGSPALQAAIKDGSVAVSAAAVIADLPKAEQTKAVKNGTVAQVAKEVKAKKSKISGGTTFSTDECEAALAADEAAKPKTPEQIMAAVQAEYDQCLEHLKQARRVFNVLEKAERSGPWLVETRTRVVQHFEGIRDTLTAIRPGGLCTKCKGKGCDFCHATGHLTGHYVRSRK